MSADELAALQLDAPGTNDRLQSTFVCLDTWVEVCLRVGATMQPHFAKIAKGTNYRGMTDVHLLATLAFHSFFTRHLELGEPITLRQSHPVLAADSIEENEWHTFEHNLNEVFDRAEHEYVINGLKYDNVLTRGDGRVFLAVETNVTHESTDEKLMLTRRLIEVRVDTLRDVSEIQEQGLQANLVVTNSTLKPKPVRLVDDRIEITWRSRAEALGFEED